MRGFRRVLGRFDAPSLLGTLSLGALADAFDADDAAGKGQSNGLGLDRLELYFVAGKASVVFL